MNKLQIRTCVVIVLAQISKITGNVNNSWPALGKSLDDLINECGEALEAKVRVCIHNVVPEFVDNTDTFGIADPQRRCCALSIYFDCVFSVGKKGCDPDIYKTFMVAMLVVRSQAQQAICPTYPFVEGLEHCDGGSGPVDTTTSLPTGADAFTQLIQNECFIKIQQDELLCIHNSLPDFDISTSIDPVDNPKEACCALSAMYDCANKLGKQKCTDASDKYDTMKGLLDNSKEYFNTVLCIDKNRCNHGQKNYVDIGLLFAMLSLATWLIYQ